MPPTAREGKGEENQYPPQNAKDGKAKTLDSPPTMGRGEASKRQEGTMARKKQEEAPKGRFCPHCSATLCLSKFNRYYCPNKYPPRGAAPEVVKAHVPCPFKGYAAGATTAVNVGEDIAPLANPSDEQEAIMMRCERWS